MSSDSKLDYGGGGDEESWTNLILGDKVNRVC